MSVMEKDKKKKNSTKVPVYRYFVEKDNNKPFNPYIYNLTSYRKIGYYSSMYNIGKYSESFIVL